MVFIPVSLAILWFQIRTYRAQFFKALLLFQPHWISPARFSGMTNAQVIISCYIQTLRSSKVVLDNGKMKGSILRDGSFTIPDVPAGTYVLSVLAPDHSFDQLRIDVVDLESKPQVRPYVIGTPLNPPSTVLLAYPITLTPKSKPPYFVPRESFNLMTMLSNPMMLMMVAGGAMITQKNMDPEAMEEFKEQHAKMASFQNAVASGDLKTG
ncbi:hypothetical protein C0995_007239 [Termitomyces sp. Mi166|nr:hypothetical protein C0995_007239 [Termitomyces sp. Mi166\